MIIRWVDSFLFGLFLPGEGRTRAYQGVCWLLVVEQGWGGEEQGQE